MNCAHMTSRKEHLAVDTVISRYCDLLVTPSGLSVISALLVSLATGDLCHVFVMLLGEEHVLYCQAGKIHLQLFQRLCWTTLLSMHDSIPPCPWDYRIEQEPASYRYLISSFALASAS
jgi:hypothetical protein